MSSIEITLAGEKCVLADPSQYEQAAGLANGYYCPVGTHPGTAYVLLTRGQLDRMQLEKPLKLSFTAGNETLAFPRMYFVKAFNVSGGFKGDPSRVYLVELADVRHFFRPAPVLQGYNVRNPIHTNDESHECGPYYIQSLDKPGNLTSDMTTLEEYYAVLKPWTWQRMVDDLWEKLPTGLELGKAPKLRYKPHGKPEGYQWHGDEQAADALDTVLRKLFCCLVYDPVKDKFTTERLGKKQPNLVSVEKNIEKRIIDDADPIIGQAALFPNAVSVMFDRRLPWHFGSDNTAGTHKNIAMEPLLGPVYDGVFAGTTLEDDIRRETNVDGAIEGRELALFDDLAAIDSWTQRSDTAAENETTINHAENESDLGERAEELTQNWIDAQKAPWGRVIYQGLPAKLRAGCEIKAIHWKNLDRKKEGFITEVLKRPSLPEKGAVRIDPIFSGTAKLFEVPHTERQMRPLYPPRDVFVVPDNWAEAEHPGDPLNISVGNIDGLIPGRLVYIRPNGGSFDSALKQTSALITWAWHGVWIKHAASVRGSTVHGASLLSSGMSLPCLPAGQLFHGRLCGSQLIGERSRPLVVIHDEITFLVQTTAVMNRGSGGTGQIIIGDRETGHNIAIQDLQVAQHDAADDCIDTQLASNDECSKIPEGTQLVVKWIPENGWVIVGAPYGLMHKPLDFEPSATAFPLLKAFLDANYL